MNKTVILPGMGADSTMYPHDSYKQLSWVNFVEWPEYTGETTIEEVAKSVIKQYGINQQTIVGGSSLGGMVAVQIAKLIEIKKVILIGSAVKPSYVKPALQTLSNFADITPVKLIQLFAGKVNFNGNSEILSMFANANSNFIKAMCKAIFNWNGIEDYECEICHIHGAKDQVISSPDYDAKIIKDGGHLISITHSTIVAEYIEKNTQKP